jgi:NAD(P)-dependent dehydrogenase (short-subunit alcohol dehydrogenase family)
LSTPQTPIGSGFTAASTAEDVIHDLDLTGKIAIVTGGYSGLGRETVRVLLEAGARVVVPARDVERAKAALSKQSGAEVMPMDLADPASIEAFSKQFLTTALPLHILINSAGIMALPELVRNARGHEMQFATNHLGHFQLTLCLWPALVKAQGARVISVSSKAHRFSPVVFDDIDFIHRPYDPWAAYAQSKTANILFAVELDNLGKKEGIRAFASHPGGIADTGLGKHFTEDALKAMGILDDDGHPIRDPTKDLKTVEQGAATQVWCATSPQLKGLGGVYCENSDIAPPGQIGESSQSTGADALEEFGVLPYAVNHDAATELWKVSKQMLSMLPDATQ